MQIAYLAIPGFAAELATELARKNFRIRETYDRLALAEHAENPPPTVIWAQNAWLAPEFHEFRSIQAAAKLLRERGRNWVLYSHKLHRRAALIQAKLPRWRKQPVTFLEPRPTLPMGAWTLLDQNVLLASASTNHPYPLGELKFAENRSAPPARAYLKLWELFTVHDLPRPRIGEFCLDLGASPGGWTWVLAGSTGSEGSASSGGSARNGSFGCRVLSVDKAPLAPAVARLPGVEFRAQSAFSLEPREFSGTPVDWLFSDVVCYPERLYKLVKRWLAADAARNYVCTIKFQGKTDFAILDRFAAIPGARLLHLHHNKHELTWLRPASVAGKNPS